ncbi:MAG: type 1 glutamine amidotransferase [Actinomycetota bacterium]
MRAALIGNREDTDPGIIGHVLRERGFSFVEFAREDPASYGDPAGFDLVVAMGSSWSAYWERVAAETAAERAFLGGAHSAGVPVLGVCFGAQQLAMTLGGTVTRAETPEIGWHNVTSISESAAVSGAETLAGQWFQWHYDRFSVPTGARALAESPAAPQAFSVGRTLALQFHPEATVSIVMHWARGGGEQELIDAGVDPAELFAGTSALMPDVAPRTERLVDWFLEMSSRAHE